MYFKNFLSKDKDARSANARFFTSNNQIKAKTDIEINNQLAKLTESKITDHFGVKYAGDVTIFKKDITNTLQIPDQLYYLLIVKRNWWRYEYWADDRIPSCKGELGTAIFEKTFYHIHNRNNFYNDVLVMYIIKDNQYWFATFKDVQDFVYKKSSWYDNRNGAPVVGFSKNLFRLEPILYV